ncbi:MAG: hypothetical protein QXO44_02820 [Thermoplasmatales archaeon]
MKEWYREQILKVIDDLKAFANSRRPELERVIALEVAEFVESLLEHEHIDLEEVQTVMAIAYNACYHVWERRGGKFELYVMFKELYDWLKKYVFEQKKEV